GGAVHHRDSGHAHVVLDRDLLAGEQSRGRALDRALPVPRVEPVLGRRRTVARVARILHGERRLGELVQPSVRREDTVHQGAERGEVFGTEVQIVRLRDAPELIQRGLSQGAWGGVEGWRTLDGRAAAGRCDDHRGGDAGSAHAKELSTRIDGLSSHRGSPPSYAGRNSRTKWLSVT